MEHTTAYYRAEANAEAKVCNWFRAARLMEKAIAVYPDKGGQLAQEDLRRMKQRLDSWNHMIATEPTEQGLQFIIPGCERDNSRKPGQLDLF